MKKILTIIATFLVAATSWATISTTNVKYIDANGVEQTCAQATVLTSLYTNGENVTLDAGWYVIMEEYESDFKKGITCNGDVHLILADGTTLKATPTTDGYTGVYLGEGNTLTIYGQAEGTGKLIASGTNYCAGIGGHGNAIVINGGTITSTGGAYGAGIGSGGYGETTKKINSITINGGTITATGGDASAGIGSGFYNTSEVTTITINGGTIIATGGKSVAGIGAGTQAKSTTVIIDKNLAIFAGTAANPTTLVSNDGTNIASALQKQYVSIPGIKVLPSVTLNTKGLATYSAASNATIYTSGIKAYAAKVDGTTVNLNRINDDINAGTGIVLYGAADTKVVMLESTKDDITTPDNDLEATTTSTEALVSVPTGYNYALGSDGLFHRYTGTEFAANRAFLNFDTDPLSNGAKFSMLFSDDDTPTAIQNVPSGESQQVSKIYNISGQKVGNNYRGIVIINGKKIIK